MTAEGIRTALNERMSKNYTANATTCVLVEIAALLAEISASLETIADDIHSERIEKRNK